MPPLATLVNRVDAYLEGLGWVSLSRTNGSIGVDRHGLWDYTWLREVQDVADVLALLAARVGNRRYRIDVWRGQVIGDDIERRHVETLRVTDPDEMDPHLHIVHSERGDVPGLVPRADFYGRTFERICSAVDLPVVVERDQGAARVVRTPAEALPRKPSPQTGWREAILRVFETSRAPLRNREVLTRLVMAGWAEAEDGPLITQALWALEREGAVDRVGRGLYRLARDAE
jgi:hypothetical protein